MKIRFLLILFTVFFGSCLEKTNDKEVSRENSAAPKEAENQQNSPEKGFSFGVKYKHEIQKQLAIWEQLVIEEIDFNQEELYDYIATNTGLIKACQEYTPELLTEINDIAKGAEVPYKSLINLNLAEEIMLYFSHGYQSCTNIGIKTKNANYLAYNLDLPDFFRINPPFILHKEEQVIYGFPGILATGGINKYFAVTTNSLPNNRMNTDGLPLPFMLRKLLNAKSIEAAKNILKTVPLAAPQNFMLASRKDIIDLESSKNQLKDASQSGAISYHTNFAIKNTDIIKEDGEVCQRYGYLEQFSKSKNVDSVPIKKQLIELLTNKNPSSILNDETYVSFVAVFPKEMEEPITLQLLTTKYFLNPELIKL